MSDRYRSQACAPPAEPGATREQIEAEVRAPDVIVQPPHAPQCPGREVHLEAYRTFPTMLEFDGAATAIVPAASGDMAHEYGVNRFVFDTPDGPDQRLYWRPPS